MKQQQARKNQKALESGYLERVRVKQELEVTARITVWFPEKIGGGYSEFTNIQNCKSLRDFSVCTLLEMSIRAVTEQVP